MSFPNHFNNDFTWAALIGSINFLMILSFMVLQTLHNRRQGQGVQGARAAVAHNNELIASVADDIVSKTGNRIEAAVSQGVTQVTSVASEVAATLAGQTPSATPLPDSFG